MSKKNKLTGDQIILARDLSLDGWLSLLGTDKWAQVYPNNCFPTEKHREEYLSQIRDQNERDFKNLARSFLNKSGYYGSDKGQLEAVIEKYGREEFLERHSTANGTVAPYLRTGPNGRG